jgi:hypothetical protein
VLHGLQLHASSPYVDAPFTPPPIGAQPCAKDLAACCSGCHLVPAVKAFFKRPCMLHRSLGRPYQPVLLLRTTIDTSAACCPLLQVELMEVVDFFRKPEKFRASGARPPKGVLLVGPPGRLRSTKVRAHFTSLWDQHRALPSVA